jgi:ubiquinone/menaquinone biosynthesis C-methylase UbiE
MRKTLFKIYWKMRAVIAPKLKHAQALYEEVLKEHVTTETTWLDLGCGHQVLSGWRAEEENRLVGNCRMIVGMDYDLPSLRLHRSIARKLKGDITNLPFADSSFDLVTANMVVEHLSEPDRQFQEVSRILKPGGVFIFHTPNALGYPSIMTRLVPDKLKDRLIYLLDGRKEEDVFDVHYKANSKKKIQSLALAAGFEAPKTQMIVSDAVFSVVPPFALPELVSIRILMTRPFRSLRTNIIATLKKKSANAPARTTQRDDEPLRKITFGMSHQPSSPVS